MNKKGLSRKHIERLKALERKHTADPNVHDVSKLIQKTKTDERG